MTSDSLRKHQIDNKNKALDLQLWYTDIVMGLVKQFNYDVKEIQLEIVDIYSPTSETGLLVWRNAEQESIMTYKKALEYAEIGKGQRRVNKTYQAVEYYIDDNGDITPTGSKMTFVGVTSDDVAEKVVYNYNLRRENNAMKISKSLVRLYDGTYYIIEEDNNG